MQLDAWPQWCRRADAEQAIQVAAKVVAPLLPEEGLEVVEEEEEDEVEFMAETMIIDC